MKKPVKDSTDEPVNIQVSESSKVDANDMLYNSISASDLLSGISGSSSSGENLFVKFNGELVSIYKQQLINSFDKSLDFLSTYQKKQQTDQAKKIVNLITQIVSWRNDVEFPEINFFEIDDGSLGLQWDFKTFTFGAGIEDNPSDSYWFMLGGEKDKFLKAGGSLEKTNILKNYLRAMIEE